jgi:hypothetical protein
MGAPPGGERLTCGWLAKPETRRAAVARRGLDGNDKVPLKFLGEVADFGP